MPILLLLLVVIPALEIYLFIEIGGAIGSGWTFVLIIVTALWGASAMRRQGLGVLAEMQRQQARGQVPVAILAHGVLILTGGALLLMPGFFTDFLGFVLMLRWGRLLIMETIMGALMPSLMRGAQLRAASNGGDTTPDPKHAPSPDTIEGEFIVHEDEDK